MDEVRIGTDGGTVGAVDPPPVAVDARRGPLGGLEMGGGDVPEGVARLDGVANPRFGRPASQPGGRGAANRREGGRVSAGPILVAGPVGSIDPRGPMELTEAVVIMWMESGVRPWGTLGIAVSVAWARSVPPTSRSSTLRTAPGLRRSAARPVSRPIEPGSRLSVRRARATTVYPISASDRNARTASSGVTGSVGELPRSRSVRTCAMGVPMTTSSWRSISTRPATNAAIRAQRHRPPCPPTAPPAVRFILVLRKQVVGSVSLCFLSLTLTSDKQCLIKLWRTQLGD